MSKQKHNFWNDEKRISELKETMKQIGHFPTNKELREIDRWDLQANIAKNGGLYKYAELLGCKTRQKPNKHWEKRGVPSSVEEMVNYFEHFPHRKEAANTAWESLYTYLLKTKQIEFYRKKYRYIPYRMPDNMWCDELISDEIKMVIKKINHFPTKNEFGSLGRWDLVNQITLHGGINKFRKLLGYKVLKEQNGHYGDEVISNKLKVITEILGYFPTRSDLLRIGESKLNSAISEFGGLSKFQKMLGVSYDYFKSYKSSISSYVVKRGKNTENIVYDIICRYCESLDLIKPTKNEKLSIGSIIEFTCSLHKKIGIDVTNCECKTSVYRKWTKKDYYKYLDELWIVVVSDSFTKEDYETWNTESPNNVYVMSIEEFCNELQYDLDETTKNKIEKYKTCTFHIRDQYKKENKEVL